MAPPIIGHRFVMKVIGTRKCQSSTGENCLATESSPTTVAPKLSAIGVIIGPVDGFDTHVDKIAAATKKPGNQSLRAFSNARDNAKPDVTTEIPRPERHGENELF